MTVINNAVRAKIEVEGVNSHQQRIPANVTSAFVVDEVVSGINSTAFAKVAVQADIGDTYIVIKQRTRYFDFEEPLVGSLSGVGESNGSMTTGSELYTNPLYSIEDGLWTLETTGDMIAKIDDSVMKINIDKGGNLASGYQFGFSLANFGLVDSIEKDGLFLKHLPTRYYIDFGAGYVQVWAGIIDTFPKTGDTTASFKCTDAGKANIEKIGSDTIPIALNRNYNCKLVLGGEKDANFDYVPMRLEENSGYIVDKTTDELGSSIKIRYSLEIWQSIIAGDFNNIVVQVVLGDGSGVNYNVVRAENVLGFFMEGIGVDAVHTLYLDNENIDDLSTFEFLDNGNGGYYLKNSQPSIIMLKDFSFNYNLSQKEVRYIHTSRNSKTEYPIKATDSGEDYFLSEEMYDSEDNKTVSVYRVLDAEDILFKSTLKDISSNDSVYVDEYFDYEVGATVIHLLLRNGYSKNSVREIIDLHEKYDNVYFRPIKVTIQDAIKDALGLPDPLTLTTDQIIRSFKTESICNKSFDVLGDPNNLTNLSYLSGFNTIYDGEKKTLDTIVSVGSTSELYDLEITCNNWESFRSIFTIENIIDNEGSLGSFVMASSFLLNHVWIDWQIEAIKLATFSTAHEADKEIGIDNISIGCNGENVQSGNEFENYPDTIQYLQENHIGIPLANIDTASYSEAQEDYDLFDSVTERNPSHQITSQTDSNSVLKDMLKSSHLGLYLNRLGKYSLENWLPKSKVFSDLAPILASYTSANWLKNNGISKISRSEITQVVSDYQLDYDLNESSGEFQQASSDKDGSKTPMRIKRTDLEVFDFNLCTEGISLENTATAQQAWELFRAGYLRAKKLTQTTLETKWIKMLFSDGTGEGEAINFIRNQAGHINRELEKVTIRLPLNATDAILNLLSFISVNDQKRTNGETRKGWIIEHKLSWENKEIAFKILLDISQFDPFLVQLNIIQDNATVTDIIQQDATATSIIQNGTGK